MFEKTKESQEYINKSMQSFPATLMPCINFLLCHINLTKDRQHWLGYFTLLQVELYLTLGHLKIEFAYHLMTALQIIFFIAQSQVSNPGPSCSTYFNNCHILSHIYHRDFAIISSTLFLKICLLQFFLIRCIMDKCYVIPN